MAKDFQSVSHWAVVICWSLSNVFGSFTWTTALLCWKMFGTTNNHLGQFPNWLIPKGAQLGISYEKKLQEFPKCHTLVNFWRGSLTLIVTMWALFKQCIPKMLNGPWSTTNRNSGQQATHLFAITLNSFLQCIKNHHIDNCTSWSSWVNPSRHNRSILHTKVYTLVVSILDIALKTVA